MADGKLGRRKILAMKIESVEGTAEASLTNAECKYKPYDLKFDVDQDNLYRDTHRATLTREGSVAGSQVVDITFRHEIMGGGLDDDVPLPLPIDVPLRCCGLAYYADLGTPSGVSGYRVLSDAGPSATIWVYEDGKVSKAHGCRGNVKFMFEAGKLVFADFAFKGLLTSDPIEASFPTGITYPALVPPVFRKAGMTVLGTALKMQKIEIDMGNQVIPRWDPNADQAIRSFGITDRVPVIKMDPEHELPSVFDFFNKLRTKTTGSFVANVGVNQGTPDYGNLVKFVAPTAEIDQAKSGNRDNLMTVDTTLRLVGAGDDEFRIELPQAP